MRSATLTFKSIRARPVVLKLKRPVIARIATITDWPLILIDLFTNEGVVGRSYLEPYTVKAMKYLVPALHDLGDMLKGRELAPVEFYELARKSLHFVGYQGLSMIAVSGLDLAAWDARAKAANVPLCVLLGGSVGPVRAYNSNGLWLKEPHAVAAESIELRDEGGFTGLKLRSAAFTTSLARQMLMSLARNGIVSLARLPPVEARFASKGIAPNFNRTRLAIN